ncbi:Lrp/AsnC ligand binding domain-containing protein [Streptomyces sp. NPDC002405]|uniref:Lrp/AsnC ligand binding domain-containing protein n=1 Tax=Streptomyces sp. NPDC001231 TaxID=3364549 RepID=UPI0036B6C5F1
MSSWSRVSHSASRMGSPDYFVAVADLSAYETFLSQRVMTIPRIKNVTSHFTMKTVKPGP